ncbi:DUF262 domain-containing protein [Nostoc sp.]|uniref:DUF262 domain-containing protein n=1 Tax=Nostoc sp. TaxID=1180 RepID=UPI0035934E18
MSSGFATPITIKDAIDHIVARTYLLPAIQRKFVWSSDQIEVLFDSIMRGYPINSFMFWEVKESEIKNEFKFYQFLTEYRQFFKEDNPHIDTKGYNDFYAVIDGQQRLTSIYIGLKGSYAYKLPRKHWIDTEEAMPTRHLYLNLSNPLSEENERQMVYDFQFLTKDKHERKLSDKNSIWYRVNDILKFNNRDEIDNYIDSQGWLTKDFTKQTIRKLYEVVFNEKLINYYLEKTQKIDTVLDIFIRTNSGGEPLSFSDLLMSITTANWKLNAREEIHDVVKKVFEISNAGFLISQDFVLKTCLFLFNENIKFQVKNFDQSSVAIFEQNWDRIKKTITESFILLSKLGFNNQNLKAKNAVIPIIYYIYHREIEADINSPINYKDDKELIKKWLCLSLLKSVFSGQSDTVLSGLRKAIKSELADTSKQLCFPLERIKNNFKGDPAKNLSFDDDLIEVLFTTQKDAPDCFAILSLIYSHLKFDGEYYHKDHLHPASYFKGIKREDFKTDEDFSFYSDPSNWNGIANLQLLNETENRSKGTTPLKDWVTKYNIDKANKFIPDGSLDISDFKVFIAKRKELLKTRLKNMVI